MRVAIIGVIFFALAALTACKKESVVVTTEAKGAEAATSSVETLAAAGAPAAPAAPAQVTVKVVNPGSEPKEKLRYKFTAGQKQKLMMDMKMAMAIEMGTMKQPEISLPVIRMIMDLESKELSKEGNLRYEFKLTQTEVLPDPTAMEQVVTAMKTEVGKIVGMTGWAVVDSRGLVKDADVALPPGAGGQIEQMVNDMRQQLRQLSAPLPEEAVGPGATWEVTMPLKTPALTLTQIATYRLEERKGDKAKLGITLVQNAPAQTMHPSGLPPGAEVKLNSMKSSGSGTVALNLLELVPSSEMKLSTAMDLSVGTGGQKQEMKNSMKMEIKIQPKAL